MIASSTEVDSFTDFPILDVPAIDSAQTPIIEFGKILCARQNHRLLSAVTLLTGLMTVSRFAAPFFLGKVIQSFINPAGIAVVAGFAMARTALLACFAVSSILSPLLSSAQTLLCERLQGNIMQQLLQKSVTHFLQRSLDFHIHTSVSEMFNLIQKTFGLESLGVSLLTNIIPTLIETAVTAVLIASQFGPLIAGSLILLILAHTAYSIWMTQRIIRSREELITVWNESFNQMGKILFQYKLMRDCNQEQRTLLLLDQQLQKLKEIDFKARTVSEETYLGYKLLSYLHMGALVLYMGRNWGNQPVDLFISLVGYLQNLAGFLPGFGQGVAQLCTHYPDLKFVFSKLGMASEIIDPHPDVPLRIDGAPEICFHDVSFQYPSGEKSLFERLSFTIPAGTRAALVSRSGAGKTSIFNMLYGYYALSNGTIQINDQNISSVSLESLQRQISLVGQNPILFQGSIRENILYGAPNPELVSNQDIYDLVAAVGFRGFFDEFPNGLDTDVGEGGKALSGGQQQKVSLLRSLMKPAKIRLLDEATASLDNLSASQMLNFLLDPKQHVTTLMITHKLTEASRADMILFLEEGAIVAQGSHEELLENCLPYRELWEAQTTLTVPF